MTSKTDLVLNLLGGLAYPGGIQVRHAAPPPEKLLKLFDIEASPYCRLVRATLTELDLDALILPCPAQGKRFRPEAVSAGGKTLFPLLVDENTGTTLYESADIIDYLRRTTAACHPSRAAGAGHWRSPAPSFLP